MKLASIRQNNRLHKHTKYGRQKIVWHCPRQPFRSLFVYARRSALYSIVLFVRNQCIKRFMITTFLLKRIVNDSGRFDIFFAALCVCVVCRCCMMMSLLLATLLLWFCSCDRYTIFRLVVSVSHMSSMFHFLSRMLLFVFVCHHCGCCCCCCDSQNIAIWYKFFDSATKVSPCQIQTREKYDISKPK